jgi:hypothetical protein
VRSKRETLALDVDQGAVGADSVTSAQQRWAAGVRGVLASDQGLCPIRFEVWIDGSWLLIALLIAWTLAAR